MLQKILLNLKSAAAFRSERLMTTYQSPRVYTPQWGNINFHLFYVYGSVHHNIFYEITNRCSYMQSILFHC